MYNKNINKAISLIVAIMLWVYVVGQINPTTERTVAKVPVKLLNEGYINDSGLSIRDVDKEYVDITVKGKRSEVNSISKSDIKVSADLKDVKVGYNNVAVNVKGPKQIDIKQVNPEDIKVYVDKTVTKTKPVKVKYVGKIPRNKEPGETYTEYKFVQVSGASSRVDKVSYLSASVNADKIGDKPKRVEAKLIPVDRNGNTVHRVFLSRKSIHLDVKMMMKKTVPLVIDTKGEVDSKMRLEKVEAPKNITIKGDENILKDIREVKSKPINISGIKKTTEIPIEVILPYGVALSASNENPQIKVILQDKASRELVFRTSDVDIISLAAGYKATVTQAEIKAKLIGKDNVLENVGKSDLKLFIDLSGLNAGKHKVKIRETHNKDFDDIVFSPKSVEVTIRKD